MADEALSEGETAPEVPTNTAEYGCISDLKKQQAETAEAPKSGVKNNTISSKD